MKIINFIRPVVNLVSILIFIFGFLIINDFLTPDFSEKDCEAIRKNHEKIKIGMSKEEILSIIKKDPDYKINRYPGVFPEQKNEWEIWMLCADLDSCIFVENLGRERCYKSHMIAFDSQTGKVVKIFSDFPDNIGFF